MVQRYSAGLEYVTITVLSYPLSATYSLTRNIWSGANIFTRIIFLKVHISGARTIRHLRLRFMSLVWLPLELFYLDLFTYAIWIIISGSISNPYTVPPFCRPNVDSSVYGFWFPLFRNRKTGKTRQCRSRDQDGYSNAHVVVKYDAVMR